MDHWILSSLLVSENRRLCLQFGPLPELKRVVGGTRGGEAGTSCLQHGHPARAVGLAPLLAQLRRTGRECSSPRREPRADTTPGLVLCSDRTSSFRVPLHRMKISFTRDDGGV